MKQLQQFQKEFDAAHFPHWKDVSYDEKLLFLSTALAGEVGEFANFVKKRHRLKVAGEPHHAAYQEEMKEELVDVFIYLLILGNLLEMDIEKAFYQKSAKNSERFSHGSAQRPGN
ncbi:nucleotide pyrophosphohydrolase [Candidatus Woesearchaeota archaeon]|nr:nucleotide pyrophosphohydrolase [Candidatus Woesearchaeota archaeon]